MPPEIRQYGSWASSITAEALAKNAIGISGLRAASERLYWLESRPDEGGRLVVMMGHENSFQQITPDGFNVRTRVHEYGGAPYVVAGDTLFFSNYTDQRLYVQSPGNSPVPLTPPGYRYADSVAAPGGGLIGIREDHTNSADIRNAIAFISSEPGDAGRILYGDSDFVAYPRLNPDGTRLAWIAWDHPNMPWDNTRLYMATYSPAGLTDIQIIAGGPESVEESVLDPQWGADGALYFVSDRSGFWNLYVHHDETIAPLLPIDAEFAGPLWELGQSNYALMGERGIVARYNDKAGAHLAVIDPAARSVREVTTPFTSMAAIRKLSDREVTLIGASAAQSPAVVTIDVETGSSTVIRHPTPVTLEASTISSPEAMTFPGHESRDVHALFYPPRNGDFSAPAGESPPLIVQVHGGPTGQASGTFNLANQFWTSRGFAIIDVDYGGSSGYGRAYRQRLNGNWGIVDVADVIAAVAHVAEGGWADPDRVAIHGGSAGGFTVLAALSQSDIFKAGASFYGVADLTALAEDTHKFESRYLDSLVGPYPAAGAVYENRSPINHLDGFRAPLIIFQGSEDPVVPPAQAHMIRNALRERGLPVAYIEYAGESHGFRRAENLIACKKAELYFYGRVFRFTPNDELEVVSIENLEPV
jgi:dipeptidyl aminopeptidase/acylaminoacyl peptidase